MSTNTDPTEAIINVVEGTPAAPEADTGTSSTSSGQAPKVDRAIILGQDGRWVAAWALRFIILAVAAYIAWLGLAQVWQGLLPIMLSILLCTVLWPPTKWLRDRGMKPGAASAITLTLHPDGTHHIQLAPLADISANVNLLLHPEPLPGRDPLRRYKTTHRAHLDAIWQQAEAQGAFDALLFNEHGQLLEGARSNVFVQLEGEWHTPPLSLDILPGITRAHLLAHPDAIGATRIHETILTRADLMRATQLIACNSLRGILPATLIRS